MPPFSHLLAGLSLGLRHRRQLRLLLDETPDNTCILTLSPESLKSSGITALALDFDGVLAHHGAPAPLPEAVEWMKQCQAVFGGERIFILSNKPTEGRRAWFNVHFPSFRFISGVRKKPYPDGLTKTEALAGVPLSQILMVDDRLLTGCLAAINAGARPCYIRKPYVSLSQHTGAEMFFMLLRIGERCIVRLFS